ncbi:MAG TPA: glycosyltransferase [Candidatus Thermoplasmatota archaeon]|nr:glycosyltransferase [Candidatus Thermoplasmatota archaeon]
MRRAAGPGPVATVLLLALGLAIGAVVAAALFAGYALVMRPNASLAASFWPPKLLHVPFAAVGVFIGLGLVSEAAHLAGPRRIFRLASGGLLGAIAGLVTYAVGYVTANYPGVPDSPYYLLYYVEAVYSFNLVEVFCVGLGALVGVLMVRSSWKFYGVLTYIALVSVVAGYVAYAVMVTLPSVPQEAIALSMALVVVETLSLTMVVVYAFYALDIFVRKRWKRSPEKVPFSRYYLPKVAFHVTTFNEPAEMVRDTLRSLMAVDYPRDRVVIMVLDDSTEAASRAPIEAFAREHGLVYLHRTDRSGYKAGALNAGLKATPEDVDLIAVIDADYQIEPEYLRETVGYFINPNLGFVQTPQDYRNMHQSFLTEQYYYADAYFYRAILPSRNEENTIIFCGTMGLLRKSALIDVGGWGEQYICEDSELSVRILERGYESLYVPKTYGRGLIPATFEAYKKQHYRWAFGGVRILQGHGKDFLFSGLSLRQKFDFLVGSVHWFDGLYIMAIAAIVAILGLGDAIGLPVVTYHHREIWLVGLVPFFLLLDGVTRLHMALRRSMHLPFLGTFRVMAMWFAIKFNNTFAAMKALVGYKLPFIRTPKSLDRRIGRREAFVRAVGLTRFESASASLLLVVALAVGTKTVLLATLDGTLHTTRLLLLFWVLYYASIFASAPLYAYKAYVTFTPEEELFRAKRRAVQV